MKNLLKENKNSLLIIAVISLILIGVQGLTGIFIWEHMSVFILMNVLILFAMILVFLGIFKNIKITLVLTTVITYLIGLINYFLIEIRGMPFVFADIFSIKSAINVASDFNVVLDFKFYLSIVIFVLIFIFLKFIDDKEINVNKKRCFCLGVFLFVGIWITASSTLYYVTSETDKVYGVLYSFLKSTKNTFLQVPGGYSKENVEELLENYKIFDEKNDEKPNIIVVMNESFSDLNSIYDLGLKPNINFINKISGDNILYSPSYGGNTANCEFEFLTGFTTTFCQDSVPYQQYIKEDLYSLVNIMNENGYKTIGMHPFRSSSYNRNSVYSYLGFEETIFDDSIDDIEIQKILNSDKNLYEEIIDIFEKKEENEKIFSFALTLQNHLPYDVDFNKIKQEFPEYINEINEFEKDYYLEEYSENKELNGYLNSVRMSDESIRDLIKYFENYDEKVIILFFGDHQPRISDKKIIEEKNNIVSYALWSNYEDMQEKNNKIISMNYLSLVLIEAAKLNVPEHFVFLEELKDNIPVITKTGYMDKENKWYDINDKSAKYYELIKNYEYIQYYFLSNDYKK